MKSLSRLLLVLLLGVVIASGLASAWFAYRSGEIEVDELFDAKLAHSARVLAALLDDSLTERPHSDQPIEIALWPGRAEQGAEGDQLATASGHAYETKLAFQVWEGDRLLVYSESAPRTQALAPLQAGFHDIELQGARWRSFALQAESGSWYLAGERADVRGDLAGDIAFDLLAPLLIQIPVLGVLIWAIILFGRRALQQVTRAVGERATGRLDPIDPRGVPQEIAQLVDALNRLLGALNAAMERERRFTADAAHEIRTPLAALRVLLANLRTASNAEERRAGENAIESAVLRLERLVAQLLALSRLDPGAPLPQTQSVELCALVREVLGDLLAAGLGAALDLSFEPCAQPARLIGDPISLSLLVRNLLDNAIRYTERGSVIVSLEQTAQGLDLIIEDSGPGIPEDARARVFERFHRELGHATEGSGLGLSIVHRVAEIHGAEVHLDSSPRLGGLRVRVRFPAR